MTAVILLTSAWIDFKTRTIPNIILIALLIWGIVKWVYFGIPIKFYFLASLVMFVSLTLSVVIMEWITKKFVLGGGDIKLISALCFACGPFVCSATMIVAFSLELIYAIWIKLSKKSNKLIVPFAPFLASGFLISNFIL